MRGAEEQAAVKLTAFASWAASTLGRRVRYLDWGFKVFQRGSRVYMCATFPAKCSTSGELEPHYTRPWMLHPDMTQSEVVQAAFKCALTAMEHEVRENFLYKGEPIFSPHFDVGRLVGLCELSTSLDTRENRDA